MLVFIKYTLRYIYRSAFRGSKIMYEWDILYRKYFCWTSPNDNILIFEHTTTKNSHVSLSYKTDMLFKTKPYIVLN